MGLFYKTLDDVKKLVLAGEFDKAKKIMREHLELEHQFNSELNILVRSIAGLQIALGDLYARIPPSPQKRMSEEETKTFLNNVGDAEKMIGTIIQMLRKLSAKGKLIE